MSAAARQSAPHTTSDHAGSAALYATKDSPSKASPHPLLDEDGRLSSAGAATSLKYARAQDLPSFPSQGGLSLSSAGAAASVADNNKKPFEHWKPGASPAANKAAAMAKNYEIIPLWQPELSKAGSKAAILAHRDNFSPESIYTPLESEHGMSAAGQALSKKSSTPPITNRDIGPNDHRKALLAATGAMASGRRRAESAPIKPQHNNTDWALKAATSSHKSQTPTDFTTGDPGFEAARIQNMAKNNVSRQMYGSAPPVAIEVDEKNRQAVLRASAVAMAQNMYAIQQTHIEEAKNVRRPDSHYGANAARNRAISDVSSNSAVSPPRYENLEEAARRLAHERLAKLHDENAEYRQYYGATSGPQRSRMSFRNRRRATSLGQGDSSDEEQSKRIKSQMSIFQSKVAEVDSKKRQADRDALLQAAHKNVTARMNKMDEQVFQNTGKSSPQQRELWERQARERAQRDSDERMVNVGKVHIGGGKYLDQSEVDAIARARLQPTLDDITDKAEKQRARDEEIRLDQERKQREAENERMRQAELKQDIKNAQAREKQESKEKKAEEKRIQAEQDRTVKEKRQAEAAAEKERARLEKEEKRKSKDNKAGRFSGLISRSTAGATAGTAAAGAGVAGAVPDVARPTTSGPEGVASTHQAVTVPRQGDNEEEDDERPTTAASKSSIGAPEEKAAKEEAAPDTAPVLAESTEPGPAAVPATISHHETPTSPTSPSKGDSKVKSWFKTRFRTSTKTQNDLEKAEATEASADHETPATDAKKSTAEELPRSDSMRDVAMAGRVTDVETDDMYGDGAAEPGEPVSPVKEGTSGPGPVVQDRSPSISSVSSYEAAEEPGVSTGRPASTEAAKVSIDRPASEIESDSEQRGRKGFTQRLLNKVKPNRDNKAKVAEPEVDAPIEAVKTTSNDDEFEEARDKFEEQKLAPPPKLSAVPSGSPIGSRERSKFTENL